MSKYYSHGWKECDDDVFVREEPTRCTVCGVEAFNDDEWWNVHEQDGEVIGVCPKCAEKLALKNGLAFSDKVEREWSETDFATEHFENSAYAWLYTPAELIALCKKDIEERLAGGRQDDVKRIAAGLKDYIEEHTTDEKEFIDFAV